MMDNQVQKTPEERIGILEAKVASLEGTVSLLVKGLLAVALLDAITLGLAIIIAINQGALLSQIDTRTCRNSGILIANERAQQKQSTPKLYHEFLPTLSDAQIQALITTQKAQTKLTIQELSTDCSASQLAVPPTPPTVTP